MATYRSRLFRRQALEGALRVLPCRLPRPCFAFASRSACRSGAGHPWPARSEQCSSPLGPRTPSPTRSEEHTSELQSRPHLVCRLLLEKKKKKKSNRTTVKH